MIVGLILYSCKFDRHRVIALLRVKTLRNHCEITKGMNVVIVPCIVFFLDFEDEDVR